MDVAHHRQDRISQLFTWLCCSSNPPQLRMFILEGGGGGELLLAFQEMCMLQCRALGAEGSIDKEAMAQGP